MNETQHTVLIIDSDPHIQKLMTIILDEADFKLVACLAGKHATRLTVSTNPDLIFLDLNLSDINGFKLIKNIRELSMVPIIVISSQTDNESIVTSLNAGANYYIFKPSNADVLLAHMNAVLRSVTIKKKGVPLLVNGPLMIDLVRHEVFLNDELVGFTPKEYNLLHYFMKHCGKTLQHREILKAVWGDAHGEDIQYLRVFVNQIRTKIETIPSNPVRIVTKVGFGYRMEISKSPLSIKS